jgi:hypothetical protein
MRERSRPLRFLMRLIATSSRLRQWCAKLEVQRSHECERGKHECLRHKMSYEKVVELAVASGALDGAFGTEANAYVHGLATAEDG